MQMGKTFLSYALKTCAVFNSVLLITACGSGNSSTNNNQESQIQWEAIEDAQEIYSIESSILNPTNPIPTYKSAGSNPISAELWPNYVPPTGYEKNTTRYLQFNEQSLIASPGDPAGEYSYLTTSDGYTWLAITTTVSAMWPYNADDYSVLTFGPFDAAIKVTTPPPGVIKVTENYKAQYMKYYANESDVPTGQAGAVPIPRYFITDQWGNKYLMQASGQESATGVYNAFQAAVLPAGWTKSVEYLTQDLILSPGFSPSSNYYDYVLFRDSADNTYNQIYWSPSGYNIAAQIQAPGMPIWGGLTDNIIRITNSWDNTIYGGGGINFFIFNVNAGTDTIEDFNGAAGDKLNFSGSSYIFTNTESGTLIQLSSGAKILLNNVNNFSSNWVVK